MAKSEEEIQWERQQLLLHYATDTRKLEIQLFWQRSLFFWGFVVAALVAFSAMEKADEQIYRIPIICFGFLTSLAWTLQNRGSKYWQEAWEQDVRDIEFDTLGIRLFSPEVPKQSLPASPDWRTNWLRSRRYSVSKLAIATSDLVLLLWFILAVIESHIFDGKEYSDADYRVISFYVITFVIGLALGFFGQSGEPNCPWAHNVKRRFLTLFKN